tara:strand:+ start:19288 stop:20718 length:1431 start_codon:yes stop_codon:yes gene_type:complete
MVTNPKFFGQSTTGSQSQIEDGIDFPHTGLLKALSTASSGRYGLSGFNITVAGTTGITVAAGEILYNGKVTAVTGASLTLSATHTNGYHLLVAPRPTNEDSDAATPLTSTVVLRNPAAANKVPAFTLGDTIIAVITHTGSAPFLQYLTYDKTSQAFSIAHDSSTQGTGTTYTEMGTIEADSAGVTIEASSATGAANLTIQTTDADRDIIFKGNDGGSQGTTNKTITFNWSDLIAQFNDIALLTTSTITATGAIISGGVTLTGGGTVTNHGDNRVVTSGAANTNLNGEANLTFNGVTLANTGSYTATGGVDVNLAVNAGTTMNAGGLISGAGIKSNKYFATAFETLDPNHGPTQPSGDYSYIFIGDITQNQPPHGPTNLFSITLPPAPQVVGRLLHFKNLAATSIVIVAQVGENIDSTATATVPPTTGSTTLTPASGPTASYITLAPLQTITLMSVGGEGGLVPPLVAGYYIMSAMS